MSNSTDKSEQNKADYDHGYSEGGKGDIFDATIRDVVDVISGGTLRSEAERMGYENGLRDQGDCRCE